MNFQYPPKNNEQLQYFPEQQNLSWGAVIGAVVSVAGGAMSANSQKKAAKKAAQGGQINVEELNRLVTSQARGNALGGLALEQELTPENAALRRAATNNLLASANRGSPEQDAALQSVLNELRSITSPGFEDQLRSRLFEQAVAQAGGDLALGGQLSTDVRNEVTRRGISSAGRVGGGQLGTSRAIVPRDLGLSSMGLRNQRLATASNLGQAEANYNQNRVATRTNTRTGLAQLLSSLSNNRLQGQLALADFGQRLQPPQTGLSPGNVADIYAGNQANALQGTLGRIQANNSANQSYANGLGNIFGAIYGNTGTGSGGSAGFAPAYNSAINEGFNPSAFTAFG